ncbi:MAG: ArnT family glycosyltransferase [Candidatus Rokuibacteriota bacterium]
MTPRRSWIWPSVVPIALAVLFALLGLRGAGNGAPMFPDAARHALNGALLHDMVRDGGHARPVEYAFRYYGRLPTISIPYHPPGFPVMEAVAFSLFGVHYETARLVVALTVLLSALLFYRLVVESYRSRVLAAAAVVVFLSIPHAQWLAQDVMLEFPTLMFMFAALLCLRRTASGPSSWRLWLLFVGLSGAAIWTKQHAAFLVAVPVGWLVLSGRRRDLGSLAPWAASSALAGIGLGMLMVSRLVQAGSNRTWTTRPIHEIVPHHVGVYSSALLHQLGWIATGLVAAALLAYGVRKLTRRQAEPANDFSVAWAGAAVGLILVLGPSDARYLVYAYPPLIVLGLALVHDVVAPRASARLASAGLVAVALLVAVPNLPRRADFVQGYNEAARAVKSSSPRRVLYCGPWNGSFIFAMRVADPAGDTAVIREDKMRAMADGPEQMEQFLHAYGVESVVLEDSALHGGCDVLRALSSGSLALQTQIAIVSSDSRRNGRLLVYRFNNASPAPLGILKMPSAVLPGGIQVDMR